MQHSTEQIVITCKECGEKVVLIGPIEEWRSRHAVLMCGSAHQIILDDDYSQEEILPTAS
jgi:hypothetical protein